MSRIFSWILPLALVLCLAGCGQNAAATWQEQYNLGVRYLSEGNYEEAIVAFTAAIEIDPKRAEAFVGRGDAYICNGETAENLAAALGDYEAAISLDETIPEAWLGLADVYIRQVEYGKAMDILDKAITKTSETEVSQRLEELQVKISEVESVDKLSFDTATGTITGCDKTVTQLIIPAEIGGVPVTAIGDHAFANCESLTSITIPNSVASIGYRAFYICTELEKVIIPDSVTHIGREAFAYCDALENVTISNNITALEQGTFCDCNSLSNITIPNGTTVVGEDAFADCDSLVSVTIPSSVISIGDSAFAYCGSLESILLPNGVETIGNWAFENCSSLISITLPKSIAYIGQGAFSDSNSLINVYYSGNAAQWSQVFVHQISNDNLLNATISYNSPESA